MTISRYSFRQVRHRLEPALRSQATLYACCSRSPKTVTSPFASPPVGVPARTGIFYLAD